MACDETMIAAGLGFSSACDAADIAGAIKMAAEEAGVLTSRIDVLCTAVKKSSAPCLEEAAREVNLPLKAIDASRLAERDAGTVTRSARAEAATGLGSLAEAAALVGAGENSQLMGPRVVHGLATCAIAQSKARR
jgi:cobalt-precorrin 5A hydrolase